MADPERNDTEIDVTPEMLKAGARIYISSDPEFDSEEEVVRRIFEAMVALHPGLRLKGPGEATRRCS